MRSFPAYKKLKKHIPILCVALILSALVAGVRSQKNLPGGGMTRNLTEVQQFFQGFETDNFWGDPPTDPTRVASGTNGITSKTGAYHAEINGDEFTRWGGYSPIFPANGYVTSVDIYLDPNGGYANDTKFDYTSAINQPDGNHRRDFIFNCGFYNDNAGYGTGNRFVCSASNNAPGWPRNPARAPFVVATSPGWYTFKHFFHDNGSGVLEVSLAVFNSSGSLLTVWDLSDPSDVIGTTVGGNRYGWFPGYSFQFPSLAIDNSYRSAIGPATVKKVTAADLTAVPNTTDWFFYNDENDTIDNNLGTFVNGPATAPVGAGSAQISVSGTQRRNLATYQFAGTPLSSINELKYSTYNPSAGNGGSATRSAYLNFNVDFNGSDTWQKRLVFLPVDNGTVTQDNWKEWDAFRGGAAVWRYSGATWPAGVGGGGESGDTGKTWTQILAQYPGIRIRVSDPWLGIRVGEPYADGYTENIDKFVFGTSTGTTIFDFDPLPIMVDDDGMASSTDCNAADPASTTIQGGITAAPPGATVKVCPGTYTEDVNVNKANLILQGSGAANTTIIGPHATGSANTVTIAASGVTVDGFTITRDGNTAAEWVANTQNQGINVAASANAVIQNNVLTGNRNAIYVGQSSNNVIIRRNTINFNRTGIHLVDNNGGLITENNITNNWTMGILYRTEGGPPPTSLTVTENNISGNWYSEIEFREPSTGGLLNMSGNYLGTLNPTRVTTQSGEPGYESQIPAAYGGSAVPPGTHPTIAGPESARVDYSPFLRDGTDSDPLTPGFQSAHTAIGVNTDSVQSVGTMSNLAEGLALTATGGTLNAGTGAYTGNFATGGKSVAFAPGLSPGQVTVNGNFALDGDDALNIEINGAGALYDSVTVNGTVTLGNAALNLTTAYLPTAGETFTIINNDGADAVSGTFAGLGEGGTVLVGSTQYSISYAGGDGNDVVLTAILAACNTVSVPTGIQSLTGVTVTVPINVDDLTGRGAFGYDTSITFNPAVLTYNNIIQVGTLSSGLTIVPNFGTPGVLNLSAFSTGATPLTGSGTLLYVTFNVVGPIGSNSAVAFSNFVFNEGNPCSTTVNGSVDVISGDLSGHVTYINGLTTPGVPNVNLSGTGSVNVATSTDSNGDYLLSGFGPGAYTVTPSKAALPLGSSNTAISNTDTTRIAQHVVGLITLNANQIIAGDVTNNGSVSNLDSTYISQWKVGIANPGVTGTWIFQPASKPYANVNASISGENYDAILKGDVTGNWNPLEAPFFAPTSLAKESLVSRKKPSKDAIVFRPDSVKAQSGSEVVVPVRISNLTDKGVTGYEFEVQYDPNVIEPADVGATSEATISEGMNVISNSPEKGRLIVFVYGIYPMQGGGDLINLHFRAIGESGTQSRIKLVNSILNEGEVESTAVEGMVRVARSDKGTIRGRLVSAKGRPVSGAVITATDSQGRSVTVRSNSFGRFEFGALTIGETYTLESRSRRGRGNPTTVALTENVVEVDVRLE